MIAARNGVAVDFIQFRSIAIPRNAFLPRIVPLPIPKEPFRDSPMKSGRAGLP